METLIALLGVIIGTFIGYQANRIRDSLSAISSKIGTEKATPAVLSGNPELRPVMPSSAIVEPKSPQLIDFEEQEQLRRMNPGKYL